MAEETLDSIGLYKRRIHWVDVAKGILILLVVLSHLDLLSRTVGVDHAGTKYIRVLNFLFGSYYMTAFFVLTGYTSNFRKSFKPFFVSSFKSLVLPAFCFSVITVFLLSFLYKDVSYIKSISQLDFWIHGFIYYWFLIALFWSRICCWFLYNYIKSDVLVGAVLCVMMFFGLYLSSKYRNSPNAPFTNNPLFYQHFLRMAFYLWIGCFYKKYESLIDKKYLLWGGILCIVFSTLFRAINYDVVFGANYAMNFDFTFMNILSYLFLTVAGSGLIVYVSKLINNNAILEYFGEYSLIVYVTHFCIIRYIYFFTKPVLSISDSGLLGGAYSLLVAGLSYYVCYYTIKLFKKRPFVFLTGRF